MELYANNRIELAVKKGGKVNKTVVDPVGNPIFKIDDKDTADKLVECGAARGVTEKDRLNQKIKEAVKDEKKEDSQENDESKNDANQQAQASQQNQANQQAQTNQQAKS